MALGAKTAQQAHHNRATTQIAQTLVEEAKQGTLSSGMIYLDAGENRCAPAQAIYTVQAVFQPTDVGVASSTRLTLRIIPTGAPDRARIYAIILPAP